MLKQYEEKFDLNASSVRNCVTQRIGNQHTQLAQQKQHKHLNYVIFVTLIDVLVDSCHCHCQFVYAFNDTFAHFIANSTSINSWENLKQLFDGAAATTIIMTNYICLYNYINYTNTGVSSYLDVCKHICMYVVLYIEGDP